jgi:hypothetical protein
MALKEAEEGEVIHVLALGPISHKVNLTKLVDQLNACQHRYAFREADPIWHLPEPGAAPGNSPVYQPHDLFNVIEKQRTKSGLQRHIVAAITDNEIFEDLYSTIDNKNQAILISLRAESLAEILASARKSYTQYAALELGAQLLALKYRRCAQVTIDPTDCGPPWHRDRRNDLFDYFGLDPTNTRKLLAPKLDEESVSALRLVGVPDSIRNASLSIVRSAAKVGFMARIMHGLRDPVFNLALGAAIGLAASVVANANIKWWLGFLFLCAAIALWRLVQITGVP